MVKILTRILAVATVAGVCTLTLAMPASAAASHPGPGQAAGPGLAGGSGPGSGAGRPAGMSPFELPGVGGFLNAAAMAGRQMEGAIGTTKSFVDHGSETMNIAQGGLDQAFGFAKFMAGSQPSQ